MVRKSLSETVTPVRPKPKPKPRHATPRHANPPRRDSAESKVMPCHAMPRGWTGKRGRADEHREGRKNERHQREESTKEDERGRERTREDERGRERTQTPDT